jgi:type VI secretion system protein ImpM
MTTPSRIEVGFYGKLPSHGDFVRRRVPETFVDAWDGWLQRCLVASRESLGASWLNVYLTSPVWRYVCAGGAMGPQPLIGLMVPSVDRVGRYFYLTIVAELPAHVNVVSASSAAGPFYSAAEQLAVDTLAAEEVDFDAFDANVAALAEKLIFLGTPLRVRLEPVAADILADQATGSWQIRTGTPSELGPIFDQMMAHRLSALYDPVMVWWTEGSAVVEPTCLIGRGLPEPTDFASFLDGSWNRSRWHGIPAHIDVSPEAGDGLDADGAICRYRSAGATDVGRVRQINQDSYLERAEAGMWVVADGVGGHSDGEVASRMVCDALADVVPNGTFEAMVDEVAERIQRVNTYLVQGGTRGVETVISGSTVVTLLARGNNCGVLWAGDSRVYRFREGRIEQLTRDHSAAEEAGGLLDDAPPNVITRAVGCDSHLELDYRRERVRPGDRFLLCSDGLSRIVPEGQLLHWLREPSLDGAVQGLMRATLEHGAPDNVTVVIVEAYTEEAAYGFTGAGVVIPEGD